MDADPKQQKRRDNALSLLNAAIEAMNLAKEVSSATPARVVFGSVGALLTMIRDSMANKADYVDLGLSCADVCRALDRVMNGRRVDELSQSVFEAIQQLATTVAEIQRKVIKLDKRNTVSRLFHSKDDKKAIAAWGLDLNRILHVFNTELALNTHVVVSDVRRDVANTCINTTNIHTIVSDIHYAVVGSQEGTDGTKQLTQTSILGESPPPPPGTCFGRDELIEKIISLTENLTSIALFGAGGIGKTSIALTILHHDCIKEQFGDNRWFMRCDQFPTSHIHFLNRLSKVIGAGVENPEDITPLRPFLSSRKMILFLDNAESILDPQGTDMREIYGVVKELTQFGNICLGITSRISTIPPACKVLDIPTLSINAARDAFHDIFQNSRHSSPIDDILMQLDFHPLSITLLATVAHHSRWDTNRLAREWEKQRTGMLHVQHDTSLAATIELSLASPMFQELGPDARELLGVIAFFPQGVNENLEWLFPTISNRMNIFDNLCILSLTYRSNGFITMLAPLRDYLCPKDPTSSPLLCTTKDCYFRKLSVNVDPEEPGFAEARWIMLEDVNVEHLLNVFISVDEKAVGIWNAFTNFVKHLTWHKSRLVGLGPKVEGLPDDHPSKPQCLLELSQLFGAIGNHMERKRLLIHTLKLQREREDNLGVAETLIFVSDANKSLSLNEEGIQQAKEALEIYTQFNDIWGQARSWAVLAWLFYQDKQLDTAEKATYKTIDLATDVGNQYSVCGCYCLLGRIYHSKGEKEKAINHFKESIGIATPFSWHDHLFWNHYLLAELFLIENQFDDANAHVEHAKSHAIDGPYNLGRAMELQSEIWYQGGKLEEAKCEALGAASVYGKIGATKNVEDCRAILRRVEVEITKQAAESHGLESSLEGASRRGYLKGERGALSEATWGFKFRR